MSDEDLQETIEAMKKLREEVTSSPEKALAFLVELGTHTPNGELHPNYSQDA